MQTACYELRHHRLLTKLTETNLDLALRVKEDAYIIWLEDTIIIIGLRLSCLCFDANSPYTQCLGYAYKVN